MGLTRNAENSAPRMHFASYDNSSIDQFAFRGSSGIVVFAEIFTDNRRHCAS